MLNQIQKHLGVPTGDREDKYFKVKKWCALFSVNLLMLLGAHCAVAQSTTFSYTAGIQMWTVPAGVTAIHVDVQGAEGGHAGPLGTTITSSTPGCGGRVQANVAVTPGQVLTINVGGQGGDGAGFTTTPGGYNGGGASHPWTPSVPTYNGGGGGGKTDISISGTELVVAGGGGGGGYNGACTPGDQAGAAGGGLTGGSAVTCTATLTGLGFTTIRDAGGGTPTIGGVGGYICCGGYYAGTAGSLGNGGDCVDSGGVGGGGGGGYFGGGGGCWMGGGGGSSYTNPAFVSAVTHTQGFNCGAGTVILCILPDAGTITGTAFLCGGDTATLSTSGITGGTWSSSSTAVATIGSAGFVTAISAGTATISYTVSNSCGTIAATKIVTVNVPSAGTITGKDTVCTGHPDTLSNTTTGGVWSSVSTALATIGSTGIVTGITPGVDTIYYTVTVSGCTVKAKKAITVRSHPCNAGINIIRPADARIEVMPNPSPGTFTVNVSSGINEQVHYVLTNMVGDKIQEVVGTTNDPLTMRLDVPAGVYILSATTLHGKWVDKVMVIK